MTLRSAMTGNEGNDAGPKVAIGFKAGQSADGGLGDAPEVAPTLSHTPSALEPTAAIATTLSQMRYFVRRLTPIECERLMGLPDDYTIPAGLDPDDPALVAEFQRIFDAFGAIMADYAHKKPPKPKSAKQVAAWLAKITNPATCPDSPRYKACGNGWATNQPRWILMRLLAKEADADRRQPLPASGGSIGIGHDTLAGGAQSHYSCECPSELSPTCIAGGGNAVATTVRGSEVAATITHGIHRYGGNDKDNNAVVVSAG